MAHLISVEPSVQHRPRSHTYVTPSLPTLSTSLHHPGARKDQRSILCIKADKMILNDCLRLPFLTLRRNVGGPDDAMNSLHEVAAAASPAMLLNHSRQRLAGGSMNRRHNGNSVQPGSREKKIMESLMESPVSPLRVAFSSLYIARSASVGEGFEIC